MSSKTVFVMAMFFMSSCGSDDTVEEEMLEDMPNEEVPVEEAPVDANCDAPKNLNVKILEQSFLGTSVELTWEAGGDEKLWKVDYKSNSPLGNDAVITVEDEPKLVITNIPRLNKAQITVVSECGENSNSNILSFDIPGGLVGPLVADMDFTLNGERFENWRPITFASFNSATTVVGSFSSNGVFLELLGNPIGASILEQNEEIQINVNEQHWAEGTYALKGRNSEDFNGDNDSYVTLRLTLNNSSLFEQVDGEGVLKITKFDREERIVEGEFSFNYITTGFDTNGEEVNTPGSVTNGSFRYTLDDPEFDVL